MSEPFLTPATAPRLEACDFTGFICIDPEGDPFWHSARATVEESLQMCFGAATEKHLDAAARKGWRCVPFAALAPHSTDA